MLKTSELCWIDGKRTCVYLGRWNDFAIVQLVRGLYSEDRETYISHMVVHVDNLTENPDEAVNESQ
jgi:hypothetical protein